MKICKLNQDDFPNFSHESVLVSVSFGNLQKSYKKHIKSILDYTKMRPSFCPLLTYTEFSLEVMQFIITFVNLVYVTIGNLCNVWFIITQDKYRTLQKYHWDVYLFQICFN